MMGPKHEALAALLYEFSLEDHVPQDHLLRSIDRFVDLSDIRQYMAELYGHTGRPSVDPELLIRMLLVGYCFVNRFERRLGAMMSPGKIPSGRNGNRMNASEGRTSFMAAICALNVVRYSLVYRFRLAFSEPISYCRKTDLRTAKTTLHFNALGDFYATKSGMVEPSGIEPLTSCMPCRRSPS